MTATSRLFYHQGYNLTGINQIISEAGIAKSTLYGHYKSKTDLLAAYADQQSEIFYHDLEIHLKDITDHREKIFAIFDYHIYFYEQSDFVGCPFLKIKAEIHANEKAAWDKVEDYKNRLKGMFRSYVKELDYKSDFTDEGLTDMLYFMLEGSTVSASISKNKEDITSALDTIKMLI
nr:TetR/AcrR family transcriptional regulator [Flavobacterium sp. ASV13]